MSINLGAGTDYTKVIGTKLMYGDSTAELNSSKNGIEIKFTASNSKSLLSAMNSVVRQLVIVGNAMDLTEMKNGLSSKAGRSKTGN